MKRAKSGDTVKIRYTGRLDNGVVFNSSNEPKPMQFVIGKNRVIIGLNEAVKGMAAGESKTVRIMVDEAFGPRLKDAVKVINRNQCPTDIQVGQNVAMTDRDIRTTVVTVVEISESNVTLDTNHPLAGKNLTLNIKLLEII